MRARPDGDALNACANANRSARRRHLGAILRPAVRPRGPAARLLPRSWLSATTEREWRRSKVRRLDETRSIARLDPDLLHQLGGREHVVAKVFPEFVHAHRHRLAAHPRGAPPPPPGPHGLGWF